jgi:hypothetical protein
MSFNADSAAELQQLQQDQQTPRKWVKPTLDRLPLKDALGLHLLVEDDDS